VSSRRRRFPLALRPPKPPPRASALANRRFRWLVLALAGVPILASYAFWTIASLFLARPVFSDQAFVYRAASAIRSGSDPYAWVTGGYTYGLPVYIYPPLWAWLQQPLVPAGEENAALLLLVLLQLCFGLFLVLLYRALRPVDAQEVVLGVLLAAGFVPVFANFWSDQVNLVVLTLGAVVLTAYLKGDRWWGGAAYGVAMALKPLQPGIGLVLLFGRRTRMVVGAAIAGILVSLLPGPVLLGEYLGRVLPAAAASTGFRDNAAPAGFLERLFHPATFYDGSAPADLRARGLYAAVVLAVVLATWWRLGRRPRKRPLGRATEIAVGAAASPLVLSIAHSFHLVLLLLPILVLLHVGVAHGDRVAVAAAVAAWLLLGPVHQAMLAAVGAGFTTDLVLRVWNESQLAGILVLWLGCLYSLREQPQEPALEERLTARQPSHPSLP
jgi:hypothetical protein